MLIPAKTSPARPPHAQKNILIPSGSSLGLANRNARENANADHASPRTAMTRKIQNRILSIGANFVIRHSYRSVRKNEPKCYRSELAVQIFPQNCRFSPIPCIDNLLA